MHLNDEVIGLFLSTTCGSYSPGAGPDLIENTSLFSFDLKNECLFNRIIRLIYN